MWVDANFKETQLDNVRLEQAVKLTADVYGSDVVYHGKVAGFAAGTGSAFALLPAQNASGNWIKIVQRVPVRIELDPAELQQHPLRIGLSVRVEVDTHDRSGAIVVTSSGKDKTTLSSTNVFTLQSTAADAEIARIIAANTSKVAP
jgi:membrane fusion protein (multidrug efflux system)